MLHLIAGTAALIMLAPIEDGAALPAGTSTAGGPDAATAAIAPPFEPDWEPPKLPRDGSPAKYIVSPGEWINAEQDYPLPARKAQHEGTVGVGFVIDETGHARDCRIRSSAGDVDLDARTCELVMANARYQPALDAKGQPIRSGATLRFTWKLIDELPDIKEQQLRFSFTLHPDGSTSDCSGSTSGTSVAISCERQPLTPALLALLRAESGGADLRAEMVVAQSLNQDSLAAIIGDREGWRRVVAMSAWFKVDPTGKAECALGTTIGPPELFAANPCTQHPTFDAPIGADGKPESRQWGMGTAYLVQIRKP